MAVASRTVRQLEDDDALDQEAKAVECGACGHEWEPTKRLDEYNTVTCPECGKQDKTELHVILDTDEPRPEGSWYAAMEDGADPGAAGPGPDAPTLDFGEMFSSETEREAGVDFAEMSPGEFVEWYLTEELTEVSVESTGLFARRCNGKRSIPTESEMRRLLDGLPSSIGNDVQQQWIAEDYWGKALEYASAKLSVPEQQIEAEVMRDGSSWLRVEPSSDVRRQNGTRSGGTTTVGGGQQQQGPTGTTHPSGGGQYPTGQGAPGGGDDVTTVGGGNHEGFAGPGGQQPQRDPQMAMMQQMMQEMREERKQMMEIMQSQDDSGSQSRDDESLTDQLDELAAAMNTVESLRDDDDTPNEALQNMQKQINQLAKSLSEQAQQKPQVEGNGMEAVFAQLAMREDVDTDTLATLAGQFGVEADPEVKKAELEMEKELKKTERYGEIVNTIFDNAGDAMADALPAAVNAALSDNQVGPNEGETGGEPVGQQVEVAANQATGDQGGQQQAQAQAEAQSHPDADAGGQQAGQPETQQSPAAQRFGTGEVELAEDAIRDDPDEDTDDDADADANADEPADDEDGGE